ncbi:Stress response protein SCP2 [Candidatus Hartigia pinicola]|nr:Stress response protein SCP2 [Candidatus Hartigia pinicola]
MISLKKNQTVYLRKHNPKLNHLMFGLGWDPIKKKRFLSGLFGRGSSIDLDASCILLDEKGNQIDVVFFGNLQSTCKSVTHSGDNLTGEGDGDDESILVQLNKLPLNIEYLAFTVNSFHGQTFNEVENAFCRVVEQTSKIELANYKLTEKGSHTGIIIASLRRNHGQWDFTAHGEPCTGQTIQDMKTDIINVVIRP